MDTTSNRIEILSVAILRTHQALVEEMSQISKDLTIGLGWHYLLDLAWVAKELCSGTGLKVMDAGAGLGVMQWWLSSHGRDILSVDVADRSCLQRRFRKWCPVRGLRETDLQPLRYPGFRSFLPHRKGQRWFQWPLNVGAILLGMLAREPAPPRDRGTVTFYNENLGSMSCVETGSIDVIISISALEHNSPANLRVIIKELIRVLKPGGKLVATLGAAKEKDWFHEPSHGWCYTETTLRDLFELDSDCVSNYKQYDDLFASLRDSAKLRENLAEFYFKSGNNGMPWGVWDPQYQSVGVVKVKSQP